MSATAVEPLACTLSPAEELLLADSRYRGYVRVELTPRRWSADLRAMETVQRRDAVCNTLASFVVEDGKPGPLKA